MQTELPVLSNTQTQVVTYWDDYLQRVCIFWDHLSRKLRWRRISEPRSSSKRSIETFRPKGTHLLWRKWAIVPKSYDTVQQIKEFWSRFGFSPLFFQSLPRAPEKANTSGKNRVWTNFLSKAVTLKTERPPQWSGINSGKGHVRKPATNICMKIPNQSTRVHVPWT